MWNSTGINCFAPPFFLLILTFWRLCAELKHTPAVVLWTECLMLLLPCSFQALALLTHFWCKRIKRMSRIFMWDPVGFPGDQISDEVCCCSDGCKSNFPTITHHFFPLSSKLPGFLRRVYNQFSRFQAAVSCCVWQVWGTGNLAITGCIRKHRTQTLSMFRHAIRYKHSF